MIIPISGNTKNSAASAARTASSGLNGCFCSSIPVTQAVRTRSWPARPGSNWSPILLKASVSEVAANTTTVPVTFPAAEALPAAAGLLEDELQAAASNATSANSTASSVRRRLRGASPERRPARPPDLRPSGLASTAIARPLRG